MRFGPAKAEDCACLSLAGFQRHTAPAKFPPEPDQLPIMRALVHEKWFARGNAVDIDLIFLKFIRKWLLDVEKHSVNSRLVAAELVQHGIHIRRFCDRAVEIGG